MLTPNEKLNILKDKVKGIINRQEGFQQEVKQILVEIETLESQIDGAESVSSPLIEEVKPIEIVQEVNQAVVGESKSERFSKTLLEESPKEILAKRPQKIIANPKDWEKFIGENLANKIGIVILILGIAIGTKYSIDHNLITPLGRILMGYALSAALGFFAYRLYKKYFNLSAVLASGAIAGFYLVSYAAFAFFKFFPQELAFFLLIASVLTSVYVAMKYKRQVIAFIGLVGAYAAPFLVSTGSNNYVLLFVYMAVLNVAILFLAYRQNWRALTYSSFIFTWIIFVGWWITSGTTWSTNKYGVLFSTVFYLLFHAFFLFSRVFKYKDGFKEIGLLVVNTAIYYLVFLELVENQRIGNDQHNMALFTFAFAVFNALSAFIIYKKNQEDTIGVYLFSGFAILLMIFGIPMEFAGNWVPVLYMVLAVGLYALSANKKSEMFLTFALPVVVITAISFLGNNIESYQDSIRHLFKGAHQEPISSLFNLNFLTSILIILGFVSINLLRKKTEELKLNGVLEDLQGFTNYLFPGLLTFSIFFAVYAEISYFWDAKHVLSRWESNGVNTIPRNEAFLLFKNVWQINWTVILTATLTFLNTKFWKNEAYKTIGLGIAGLAMTLFLFAGLFIISDIREFYTHPSGHLYKLGFYQILFIRYISILFMIVLAAVLYLIMKKKVYSEQINYIMEIVFHVVALWVICSEVLHWMDIAGHGSAYKAGMSITAGLYAILLVGIGIWKKKPHLRVMAFILFGVILVKLFFYDISNMSRIAKTVVFILLGGMLLLISFLYNKYKSKMEND